MLSSNKQQIGRYANTVHDQGGRWDYLRQGRDGGGAPQRRRRAGAGQALQAQRALRAAPAGGGFPGSGFWVSGFRVQGSRGGCERRALRIGSSVQWLQHAARIGCTMLRAATAARSAHCGAALR